VEIFAHAPFISTHLPPEPAPEQRCKKREGGCREDVFQPILTNFDRSELGMEREVSSNTLNWRAKKAQSVFGKPLADFTGPKDVMRLIEQSEDHQAKM
jgi:hypothetical protein